MDKSWMFLPRQTKEYRKGLESFLDFAFSNANINGMIACPFAKCKIGICVSREDACDHLTVDGFIKGMASEGKTVGKPHFQHQDKANTQSRIMIANHAARSSKKEVQNIQGMLNNQMDGVSKHQHNDLQDVDSESESLDAEKKTRGPTFMKEIWGRPSTLPRIKIRCDDMGRPIGSRRNKFTDFLGTLARNGKFCLIDVEDWHKMPLDSKKKMLDVIKIGCSVSIKSLFDSTKIVAKGVVRTMDPNTEVGRQTLEPNWCEIQVLVVLEREESLIRPYDLYKRLGIHLEE
ncbi:uncharacterized protein [Primulina eburnea]|uniref:uncharacterized protein isoform X2 n=1 Tax=Primulina eburnea TaxID=1245227 RepID=UPI003C6C6C38